MREEYTDLRIIRTKQAILDALIELINEKGFESLTVKDITTRAQINRGTFYAHYQDKFDLMDKCEEEIMREISKIGKQNFPSVIAALEADADGGTPLPHAVAIFTFLNENREFMKAVLGPKGALSFQTTFKDFMWKTMFGNHSDTLIREEGLLVPGHFLASYLASAHIGVIQEWIDNGSKESPEEMARILTIISMNGPFFAAGLKKRI